LIKRKIDIPAGVSGPAEEGKDVVAHVFAIDYDGIVKIKLKLMRMAAVENESFYEGG